ncbi:MAG: ParB/RepB/Spo0J family partition protein [Nitrososphaerota archaeon]
MKVIGVERIPLDRIKVPDWAKRIVIADRELEDLARSMETMGQIEPIIVRRMGDGGYELISGYRRLMALKKLGALEAEAKIVECDDFEAIALSIEENLKRSDEHPFDTARKIAYMHKELGLSVRKIGRMIGRDDSWVGMMLSIDSMDPEIKKILAQRVKDIIIIHHVTTADDPEDQRALALAIVRRNLRRKDVEEIKKKAEDEGLSIREVLNMLSTSEPYKSYSGDVTTAEESQLPESPGSPVNHVASKPIESSRPMKVNDVRECDLCGGKINKSEGKWRFICRDKHRSIDELFKLIRKHGYEKIEDILDYLIIEAENLVQYPEDQIPEILRRRRLIAEKTGGLDIYMLDQLLEEVEKRGG